MSSCVLFCLAPSSGTYILSLHDALPISETEIPCAPGIADRVPGIRGPGHFPLVRKVGVGRPDVDDVAIRSEEYTSELQSRVDLVCRLLLEKKKRTGRDMSDVLISVEIVR